MNPNLRQATNEVNQLNTGEEFILKDLFPGYQWKRITRADRLALGNLFIDWAKNEGSTIVDVLGKNSANQQIYSKK